MYPRNSASPEPIAIGPVVQISDGAVQTAGVTVRVKPIGVTEADGGGTTAYSTDGVVLYTPTQAETNYTSFVLIAKKTGCIPASVTVVTSARSVTGEVQVGGYASGQVPLQPTTAGRTLDVTATGAAGIDLANVENQGSTLNLTGTTIKTATDIETDTQDIQSRIPAALVDGRMVSLAQAVTDKNGYRLASDGLSLVTAWAVAITGNITGNLSGSVGSISGVTFPTHFASLGINASGHISRVTLVDTTTTNTDMRGTDGAALATNWTATRAGYLDGVLIAANYNQRTVSVTGSNHVAADIHELQPAVINNTHFDVGAIDASAIASDAATEIATAVGNLQVLSRLDSMIESDGNGQFRFDTIALSMAAGGAGGTDWTANERTAIRSILGIPASGTTPADPSVGILDTIRDGVNSIGINVYPVTSSTPERVNGTTITVYKDEQTNVTISTTATLTGLTLRFVAEDRTGADVLVVENASFVARTATSVTLQIPSSVTDEIASYTWTLRDVTTGNSVLARGVLSVQAAASKNA